MVKVPTYQQDVSLRPIYQQDLEIRARPEAFGWDVGQGMVGLAKGAGQAANALIELKDLEDATAGKDGLNRYMEWTRNAQWGPGGYMTLQGQDAINGRAKFEQEAENKRKEIAATLSPGAQRKFKDPSLAHQNGVFQQSVVHEATQKKAYVNTTSTATLDNFANQALVNFADPAQVYKHIAAGQMEIRGNAALNGQGPEIVKQREEAFISNTLKGVTQRLLEKSPLAAQKFYDENKGRVLGPDQFELERKMKEGVLDATAAKREQEFFGNVVRETGLPVPSGPPTVPPGQTAPPGPPAAGPKPNMTLADTGPTRVRAYLTAKATRPEEKARVESLDPSFAANIATMMQDAPQEMRDRLGVYSGRPQRPGAGAPVSPPLSPAYRPRGPVASFAPEVNAAIDNAARKHGLPPEMLREFARIESSGNPGAVTGKYMGLFQLSQEEFSRLGGTDIRDPVQNADIAAKKLKTEIGTATKALGRAPTAFDLYMIHQQGIAGYPNHVKNPNAPAWQNMHATGEGQQKGPGWAKLAIWGNVPDDVKARFGSVDNITSAQFVEIWKQKFRGDSSTPLGGSAPPGSPYSVDLSWDGQPLQSAPKEVQDWVHQNAPRYGLFFPAAMPWRVEQIGAPREAQPAPTAATVRPANSMLSPRAMMPSMQQMSDYLNTIEDPQERDRTYKRILARYGLADKVREAQVNEAKLTLQSHVIAGSTPDTLPLETRILAGTEAVNSAWSFVEKEKQGRVVTDEVLFAQMRELAARDPGRFAEMDLTPLMGKLSRDDWRKANELKTSALTDERKAREAGLELTSAFNQAATQLEAVGITTKGKKDNAYIEAQKRISQFNNALADEMEAFKKNKATNPTQPDIQQMINKLLMPIVIKDENYFGKNPVGWLFGYGEKKGFAFDARNRPDDTKVEAQIKYEEIPIDLRRGIATNLERELGRKPTKEEITGRYQRVVLDQ